MARRKELPGIKRESAGLARFQEAIVAKAQARGLDKNVRIPEDLVDEVVNELYGGWTDQARSHVEVIEERDRGHV